MTSLKFCATTASRRRSASSGLSEADTGVVEVAAIVSAAHNTLIRLSFVVRALMRTIVTREERGSRGDGLKPLDEVIRRHATKRPAERSGRALRGEQGCQAYRPPK
ncbi:hypothetical protein GCM10017774_43450 [Lentzea cavernae]|uniref:Uncharacterized protein n=1 Tax=Lentzea cavernae TaxID=2020703 RepID=A0ABQ3MIW8_9PSEU|nr:hypothetical protein GCM10017774_43450 [Lentzea cavernae]